VCEVEAEDWVVGVSEAAAAALAGAGDLDAGELSPEACRLQAAPTNVRLQEKSVLHPVCAAGSHVNHANSHRQSFIRTGPRRT